MLDAVKLDSTRIEREVPLIGFSGSPWTVATYMVKGGSSKDFATIKSLMMNSPELDASTTGESFSVSN